jgi:hypothetical protein
MTGFWRGSHMNLNGFNYSKKESKNKIKRDTAYQRLVVALLVGTEENLAIDVMFLIS